MLCVEEVYAATRRHVYFINLVASDLIVELQDSAVENGYIPVLVVAASQEESNFVIYLLKTYFIEGLHLVQCDRLDFARKDVVVLTCRFACRGLNAVVKVKVAQYVHTLPEVA